MSVPAEQVSRPEVESRPQQTQADTRPAPELSTQDRIKAAIFGGAEERKEPAEPRQVLRTEPRSAPELRAEEPASADADPDEIDTTPHKEIAHETQEETEEAEPTFETLSELEQGLGWDSGKMMDLSVPVKIDGKESTIKLRDAIKSFQLEGHLNQKLTAFADERKAFELQASRAAEDIRGRMQQMHEVSHLAEQLLHAEFATTNWDQLRAEDPATYNSKVVEFQDRQRKIQQLASAIGAERTRFGEEDAKSQATRFTEEQRLLETKIPEWADKAVAQKDITAMSDALQEAYGISKEEVMGLTDHRMILAARDAWKWQQLQKSKPATLNKVKDAPRLIKAGTAQSKEEARSLETRALRERLRRNGGKPRDAIQLIKRAMFPNS